MRHCAQFAAVAMLIVQAVCGATFDDFVPAPMLRPADVRRFSVASVKIGPADIDEIRACLRQSHQETLAMGLTDKPSLNVLSTNIIVLSELATSSSFKLQEWALNALGERVPVPTNVFPGLLTVLTNTQADEYVRALAARVVALSDPASESIAVLAAQISRAPPELQVLLLELVGLCGPKAQATANDLHRYLNAPSGAVQFNALRAIQQIAGTTTNQPTSDFELGLYLLEKPPGQTDATAQQLAMSVLANSNAPMYLECAALLALADVRGTRPVVESLLDKASHSDAFIARIAANLLQSMSPDKSAIPTLGDALCAERAATRLEAARALRRFGTEAAAATNSVANSFARAAENGASLPELIALLELARAMGNQGRILAPGLTPLLAEQCPVYRELPKGDVHHLRTWIFVTMADLGAPKAALPAIMDALANTDDGGGTLFAAAARAAATLGPDARDAVPFLLRPFENTIHEQFITFDAFGAHVSASGEYTTCELEALRALQMIGPSARSALPALRAFAERPLPPLANGSRFKRVPHPQKEALKTIAAIEAATAERRTPQ